MKLDYTIKGTKLPFIPKGTEYRVVDWDSKTNNNQYDCNRENHISFGYVYYKGDTYILCEKPEYKGKAYYMVKLSDIEKLTETKQEETMERKISYFHAQRIIDIACRTWKDALSNSWSKDIVLKNDILIIDEDYQKMRNACTSEQHKLFDDIFGEDTPELKAGDWIYKYAGDQIGKCEQISKVIEDIIHTSCGPYSKISFNLYWRLATEEEIKAVNVFPDGTPCLVRGSNIDSWSLRYANGKGSFYPSGKKSGINTPWKQSMKLDMNNLPVNE